MKISTLQENLKQGLMMVGHIAGKNINLPILNNVMISAREGSIKLITTNLEMGAVKNIRGKIEVEGDFTVDAKTFSDYISLLPNKNKNIEIELKNDVLVIQTEGYKTKITGQHTKDFPLIPVIDKKFFYSAPINEIKTALSQTVFAVSTSETRMELAGVLFNFHKNKLILAATDSYRLAEKEVSVKVNQDIPTESVQENEDVKNVIVPSRTVQELVRILSSVSEKESVDGDEKEVKFYISDNQIMFSIGGMELISRIIEGQYPDYRQIFPEESKTNVIINRLDLIRAVKASSIFSKTGINDVNLDFPKGKNKTVVSSASSQTGESIIEIDSQVQGEDNGLVVNYRYLLDGLNNIDEENVRLEIVDANTPCIIRPEKEKEYLYIVMPIKQ